MNEDFRDRSERLSLFGILSVILGLACGLLGLAHLFIPTSVESQLLGDPRSLLMSALTYCIFGAILIWGGIGSLRKRRWVQPIMLTIGWCWLLTGLLCLLLVIGLLDDLFILATAGLEELPPQTGIIVKSFMLAAVLSGGILLPGLFIYIYRDRNILRTCEHHDPVPSWTESCPRPVLVLSTALGLTALLLVPLALKPLFPLFGSLVTGWAGSLLTLATAAFIGCLARASFKLLPSAWWGAFLFLLLFGISTALTFLWVDPLLLYRAIGYPEQQLMELESFGAVGRQLTVWITMVVTVASLAYLLTIRKYFVKANGQT